MADSCGKCGCGLTAENQAEAGRALCKPCRNEANRSRYVKKGPPERYGPAPKPGRDGDKVQARQRVNVEVRTGRRPHPNTLACTDCGHIYLPGGSRHEYDHHKGYAPENHYEVEPVCKPCHVKRDNLKAKQTHCLRGHAFDATNTIIRKNGTRWCRTCCKLRDAARPPRGSEHWARVNAKRRAKKEVQGADST